MRVLFLLLFLSLTLISCQSEDKKETASAQDCASEEKTNHEDVFSNQRGNSDKINLSDNNGNEQGGCSL